MNQESFEKIRHRIYVQNYEMYSSFMCFTENISGNVKKLYELNNEIEKSFACEKLKALSELQIMEREKKIRSFIKIAKDEGIDFSDLNV